uniref:Integrase zinc-binding domain-containing protein n=1 Tax=Amphimedon queenslandica TaxID=400682 RepID=A0A1X7VY36_AMPQE
MRFDYTIAHVPGKQLIIADTLSRAPSREPVESDLLLQHETRAFIEMIVNGLPATEKRLEEIKCSQEQDEICREIKQYCLQRWPHKSQVSQRVHPYYTVSAEISCEGLLLRVSPIIIPQSLRKKALQQIHAGHQGITKCRDRARQSVWWPGLSSQLQDVVSSHQICCQHYSQ